MTALTEQPTLRLLLVDDHSIVREGVRRILEAHEKTWLIDEASNGFDALAFLRSHAVDLVIVDLSMPGLNGVDLIQRIRLQLPHVRILVLSMHAEEQYAMRSFKAGANGYLTKDSATKELLAAVNKLLSGGAYVSASLAERVVQQLNGAVGVPSHASLSNRELEVLRRLVDGQRLTDIADDLHLSIKTISTHKTRIQEKLQLPNLAAIVRYGLENQLGEQPPPTVPGLLS
ncbi:response regulator [Roseateles oligotrophus]|uniref:Response regulator transcription factor n=1 Tax=Roseateles oligotrophus TaxID=1769250 RepID=A0ABT2YN20_9BURK|nr:response regulator transcription factor [Roseateles oligotrophus]MCV2371326.1 response regulator transcription factor [Roseateles oligotrophus]